MDAETGKRVALEDFAANIDLELAHEERMDSGLFREASLPRLFMLKKLSRFSSKSKI